MMDEMERGTLRKPTAETTAYENKHETQSSDRSLERETEGRYTQESRVLEFTSGTSSRSAIAAARDERRPARARGGKSNLT